MRKAKERGLNPKCVCFDSWYSSLNNLHLINSLGWTWLTRLKSNRLVRVDHGSPQAISTVESIGTEGREIYLPGYGLIRVFRVIATNGDVEHWASNDLKMDALTLASMGSTAGESRSFIGASSSSVGWNAARRDVHGRSATTSV